MILFSDFDGTLCPRDNKKVFHENLVAVQKFRKAGNIFCLATGRSLSSLKRQWTDCQNYLDYIILDNGSVCIDNHEKVIFEHKIPHHTAQAILRQAIFSHETQTKFGLVYYHDMTERQSLDGDVTKIRCWVRNDKTAIKITETINCDFSEYAKAFPMLDVFPSGLSWLDTSVGFTAFVDIVPRDAGKERSVAKLARLLNFDIKQVVTVGDDTNDLEMIKEFNGYAMKKSVPALLQAVEATHIVSSVANLITKLKQ